MAQRPNISKKKALKRTSGRPSNAATSLSKKTRREITGTFEFQARREEINKDKRRTKKGMVACERCGAVYFDKHWHSPSVFNASFLTDFMAKAVCDECRLIAKASGSEPAGYAGELTLEGLHDAAVKAEVLGLVRNVGKRATNRDPEDRIVKIAEKGGAVIVYTTENQLAVSIGKQVDRSRKGGTLTITWSSTDKPARVHWVAPKREV